jgi:hypothetical protein
MFFIEVIYVLQVDYVCTPEKLDQHFYNVVFYPGQQTFKRGVLFEQPTIPFVRQFLEQP